MFPLSAWRSPRSNWCCRVNNLGGIRSGLHIQRSTRPTHIGPALANRNQRTCKLCSTSDRRNSLSARAQPDVSAAAQSSTQQAPTEAAAASAAAPVSLQSCMSFQDAGPLPLLPIKPRDGALLVDEQTILLEGLCSSASVREEDEGIVVGVSSDQGSTSQFDIALGQLNCRRFLACARCKLWWMTPEWGSSVADLPPETQFLLLELEEGGPYAVLLPLIDSGTFRATLRPPPKKQKKGDPDDGRVYLRIESGKSDVVAESWDGALYIAAGREPFQLAERAVAAAAARSGGAKPRGEKQLPGSLDVFGWCTWDAFYSRVSARGVREGLQSLSDAGVPPRLLIIDDGWQCTDVDPALRAAPTERLLKELSPDMRKQLKDMMPEAEETRSEFEEAELEALALGGRNLSPTSSAGIAMREVVTIERELKDAQQQRHARRGRSSKPGSSRDSRDSRDSIDATTSADGLLSSGTVDGGSLDTVLETREGADGVVIDPEVVKEGPPAVVKDKESVPRIVMRAVSGAVNRLIGLFFGLLEAALLTFYQYIVDTAEPGSWAIRFFSFLATRLLKGMLLEFYAASGDFTRRLTSIRANSKFSEPNAGPEDLFSDKEEALREVVLDLKHTFGLAYIYCWHGLSAYWSGIAPGSDEPEMAKYDARILYATPTPGLIEIEPSMAWNPSVVAGIGAVEDPSELYNDMHSYLASAGVTGVKVDCQAGVGLVGSAISGGPTVAATYHKALEASVQRHFPGNQCINCMCHSSENIYRFTDTAIARASDDFYPREPASSAPHVAACAFNSMFLGALVQPDWDMFQSRHPAAQLHATARAVSGGAVYVSDHPGEHDLALLRRLVLADGGVLRAQLPGRPTRDSLFSDVLRDGQSLLKVWNMNRQGGVVGVFHLQGSSWDRRRRQFVMHDKSPAPLTTLVSPADVAPFADAAGSGNRWWAVFVEKTGKLQRLGLNEGTSVRLGPGEAAAVTVAPILELQGRSFGAIGLTNMLNSGGAVVECELAPAAGRPGNGVHAGVEARLRLRGSGQFAAYCSTRPAAVTAAGRPLDFSFHEPDCRLLVEVPTDGPLEREVIVAL